MEDISASVVLSLIPRGGSLYYVGDDHILIKGIASFKFAAPPSIFATEIPNVVFVQSDAATAENVEAWLRYATDATKIRSERNEISLVLEMGDRTVQIPEILARGEHLFEVKRESVFVVVKISYAGWNPMREVENAILLYRVWKSDGNDEWLTKTFLKHPVAHELFTTIAREPNVVLIPAIAAQLTADADQRRAIEDSLEKTFLEGGAGETLALQMERSGAEAGERLAKMIAKIRVPEAASPPPAELREMYKPLEGKTPENIGGMATDRPLYYDEDEKRLYRVDGIRTVVSREKGDSWLVRGRVRMRESETYGSYVSVSGLVLEEEGRPIPKFFVEDEGEWTSKIGHAPTGDISSMSRNAQFAFANVARDDRGELRTLRVIARREELTIDYGEEFFRSYGAQRPFLHLKNVATPKLTPTDTEAIVGAMTSHVWDPAEAERLNLIEPFLHRMARIGPWLQSLPIYFYLSELGDNKMLSGWNARVLGISWTRPEDLEVMEMDEGIPEASASEDLWLAAVVRYDNAVKAVESLEDEELKEAARHVVRLAEKNFDLRVENPSAPPGPSALGRTYVPELSLESIIAAAKEARSFSSVPLKRPRADTAVDAIERTEEKVRRLATFVAKIEGIEAPDTRVSSDMQALMERVESALPSELTKTKSFVTQFGRLDLAWAMGIVDGKTTWSYGDAVGGMEVFLMQYAQRVKAIYPEEFEKHRGLLGNVVVGGVSATPEKGIATSDALITRENVIALEAMKWPNCEDAPTYTTPSVLAMTVRALSKLNEFRSAYVIFNAGCELLPEAIRRFTGASVWVQHSQSAIPSRPIPPQEGIHYVTSAEDAEVNAANFVVLHSERDLDLREARHWYETIATRMRGSEVRLIASERIQKAIARKAKEKKGISSVPLRTEIGEVATLRVYEETRAL